MPIYEYKCKQCGKIVETLVLKPEDEPKKCPYCGGKLVKIFSGGVGFVFKGAGFYATDYKAKEERKSKKEEKKED